MKKIVKLREGDTIPGGAKYLYSAKLPDRMNSFQRYQSGIFFTKTWTETPIVVFHYYEVQTYGQPDECLHRNTKIWEPHLAGARKCLDCGRVKNPNRNPQWDFE